MATIALFQQYPDLEAGIAHIPLGQWPTPVERLNKLEASLQADLSLGGLYIKRDDRSAPFYGGNKIRNLEFLLGAAQQAKKKRVLTFGGAGSNQMVATAIYGRQAGLESACMLVPQPNAHALQRNLLMSLQQGMDLYYRGGVLQVGLATLIKLLQYRLQDGQFPYIIAPGGSTPVGMLGFVNAALELADQVRQGLLPEPDLLYAPLGTMGTVIGLLLGLKAAGLKTKVVAVRVTEARFSSLKKARRFFYKTNRLLHQVDSSFPQLAFPEQDFSIRHDFYGEAYGLYTEASMAAVKRIGEAEGLFMEGTYTGKALAAMLNDAESGQLKEMNTLFWNTTNARDFSAEIAQQDYHRLPARLQRYFEEEVQPLDQ